MVELGADKQYKSYLNDMDEYIQKLKTLTPDNAKEEAKESLMRSGIMNKKGQMKRHICD